MKIGSMKTKMMLAYLFALFLSGCVGQFAQWNSWSACSVDCGKGWSSRERITKRNDSYTEVRERRLCEVKCNRGENVALHKNITSSSVFLSSFPNSNAVDGNTNSDFFDGKSCTMTNKDKQPFLRIDLGKPYAVNEVVVYNRGGCCGERLNNLVVSVGIHPLNINDTQVCGARAHMENRNVTTIRCRKNTIGRYVQLIIPGPQFLSVCEVEVYGKEAVLKNIALGKPAYQSTTGYNDYTHYKARMATDGDYSSLSRTYWDSKIQWWEIDLGEIMHIHKIRIFTFSRVYDYVKGSRLSMGNDIGMTSVIGNIEGQLKTQGYYEFYEFIFQKETKGRIINVQKANNLKALIIREMEVYSFGI